MGQRTDALFLPGLESGADSPWCQRWTQRRSSWRHLGEGGFDRRRYRVEEIGERDAATFIRTHHYSGQWVAALRCYGLLDHVDGRLVGVAALSVPVSSRVLTNAFPTLKPYRESAELGRLCLLDECAANSETFMLARVFRLAREAGFRGIVSFADPMPRHTLAGDVVLVGHVGAIYQATAGSIYTGRGTPRTLLLLPDGMVLNDRALQKIRSQDQGHAYVEARLVAAGAHPRTPPEDPRAWLAGALDAAHVRRVRHRGPHRYLFSLGSTKERARLPIGLPTVSPRPKQPDLDPHPPPRWP